MSSLLDLPRICSARSMVALKDKVTNDPDSLRNSPVVSFESLISTDILASCRKFTLAQAATPVFRSTTLAVYMITVDMAVPKLAALDELTMLYGSFLTHKVSCQWLLRSSGMSDSSS